VVAEHRAIAETIATRWRCLPPKPSAAATLRSTGRSDSSVAARFFRGTDETV
jgi:hypothetical protein